ncbi:MAG TPA: hypothetical protein VFS02_22375 [Telluria sp.]|nr:hypothetical protein [Telluria sp.]
MKPSVIVHGPRGCGKTRNRFRLLRHFDLEEFRDSWGPTEVPRAFGTLYLTNFEPQGLNGTFQSIELVSFAALKAAGVVS